MAGLAGVQRGQNYSSPSYSDFEASKVTWPRMVGIFRNWYRVTTEKCESDKITFSRICWLNWIILSLFCVVMTRWTKGIGVWDLMHSEFFLISFWMELVSNTKRAHALSQEPEWCLQCFDSCSTRGTGFSVWELRGLFLNGSDGSRGGCARSEEGGRFWRSCWSQG